MTMMRANMTRKSCCCDDEDVEEYDEQVDEEASHD
jgi:hypothetical protein